MRADIAESERLSGGVASKNQRNLETRGGRQPPAANLVAAQDRVPKTPEEFVAALRGIRDCDWCGLLHYGAHPMIAAAMIYGPPGLPNPAIFAPFVSGGFLVP